MKNNKFQYQIIGGLRKGFFNIYQGRGGKIYIQMGNCVTALTLDQINELGIDVYSLDDYNHDMLKEAYNI